MHSSKYSSIPMYGRPAFYVNSVQSLSKPNTSNVYIFSSFLIVGYSHI